MRKCRPDEWNRPQRLARCPVIPTYGAPAKEVLWRGRSLSTAIAWRGRVRRLAAEQIPVGRKRRSAPMISARDACTRFMNLILTHSKGRHERSSFHRPTLPFRSRACRSQRVEPYCGSVVRGARPRIRLRRSRAESGTRMDPVRCVQSFPSRPRIALPSWRSS
jgi:hypothetical protein